MIPALPPRRRRLRSLALPLVTAGVLAGGLGYLARIWPDPEPFVVPRDRTPVALVPATHGIWANAFDEHDPRCLALFDDYLRRPNWTLTLDSGYTHCVGEEVGASLTVDVDGDAMWTGGGLPARPLHLSPMQIAKIHAAANLSCALPEGDIIEYSSRFVDVHWGGREAPARRVRQSPAQIQLDAVIHEAIMQYRHRRLAERTDFTATVAVEPYTVVGIRHRMTVTFDGRGTLSIRIRGRTITATDLDIDARVDAIDWVEMGGPPALPMPPSLVHAIDRATFDAGMHD